MTPDHSNKRILARGCDPLASQYAAHALPPLMGNPEYVATTDDTDFINKLTHETWSLVYFAPGACRFSGAKAQIPGGIQQTRDWTLEDYKALVRQTQGENVQIVETQYEQESVTLLKTALAAVKQ